VQAPAAEHGTPVDAPPIPPDEHPVPPDGSPIPSEATRVPPDRSRLLDDETPIPSDEPLLAGDETPIPSDEPLLAGDETPIQLAESSLPGDATLNPLDESPLPPSERPLPHAVGTRSEATLERPDGGDDWTRNSERAPRRPRSGGRSVMRARAGALLALAAAVFAVWFLLSLFQPFTGNGSGEVIVSIPTGSSASRIGSILARDGVVSSGFFFDLRALLEGKRGSLHSGRYRLRRNMSYASAIEALSKPPPAAIIVNVVIPEGYTRLQIARLAGEDGLSGSYLLASQRSSALKPTHYGAPLRTGDLEGFLFPATYEIDAGAPVGLLVSQQLRAFQQRFATAEIRRAHELGVTAYGLLTVASMIEREAQTAGDRPLIAAVIYNRLRQGMPLGIDATIYYAVELQKQIPVYAQELTEAQLHIASPYNTRIHKGLPPTPISNPGLASIEAAAHPAHVPYLYYVAAADGCGEQAFSSSYAGFQANVAAYRAAVSKNGGHPPRCKRK
jgi:peptidoglycan lytic transglycosylase G